MSWFNNIIFLLPVLFLAILPVLYFGKRAIVRGDWTKHRNFMMTALGLWAVVMALLTAALFRHGFENLFVEPHSLPLPLFYGLTLVTSAFLVVTLLRVVKHQYLPHKLLARKVIYLWGFTSAVGAAFLLFLLYIASIL